MTNRVLWRVAVATMDWLTPGYLPVNFYFWAGPGKEVQRAEDSLALPMNDHLRVVWYQGWLNDD